MNIALIDDDSTIRKTVSAVLRSGGSVMSWDSISEFGSADDFFYSLNENGIDHFRVIVCDNDLGKDQPKGYDILTHLHNIGFTGMMILLTGDKSTSMALRMSHTFSVHYVVKSFAKGENNAFDALSSLIGKARE